MDYLDTDDLDCIAFIDEKTNNVVIKFLGIPNKKAAEMFTDYVMMTLGVEYQPLSNMHKSRMIH